MRQVHVDVEGLKVVTRIISNLNGYCDSAKIQFLRLRTFFVERYNTRMKHTTKGFL